MKKLKIFIISAISIIATTGYANIPYCAGTHVSGSKDRALQEVVKRFAEENNCNIGTNCLLNFDGIKYSIAWSQPCPDSAARWNSPLGSTFICANGICQPYGFEQPAMQYQGE